MFLEKINQYPDEAQKLRSIYSKNCKICNGEGVLPSLSGFRTCNCVKDANINARLLCNGMPRKYLSKQVNQLLNIDQSVIDKIIQFCTNIENGNHNYDLFIDGVDKVKIMETVCAISNYLANKKNSFSGFYNNILIVTVEDLMQTLHLYRNNIEQKNKMQKILNSVDILVLNYLGEETDNRTEQTAKYINDLIVQRSFNDKVNILSSSLSLEGIANNYGISFITTIKSGFKPIKLAEQSTFNESGEDENGYY